MYNRILLSHKSEFLPFAMPCVDLKGITLNETGQTEKKYIVWSLSYLESKRTSKKKQKTKLIDTDKRLMVERDKGWGGRNVLCFSFLV